MNDMNKTLRAVVGTGLAALVSLCLSCGSDDSPPASPWTCQDIGVTCPKEGNAPVLTCKTSDQKSCKYTVNSTAYACDCSVSDCATVSQTLLAYCKS